MYVSQFPVTSAFWRAWHLLLLLLLASTKGSRSRLCSWPTPPLSSQTWPPNTSDLRMSLPATLAALPWPHRAETCACQAFQHQPGERNVDSHLSEKMRDINLCILVSSLIWLENEVQISRWSMSKCEPCYDMLRPMHLHGTHMEVDDVLPGGHGHQIYPDISRYGMDNISKAGKMMEKSSIFLFQWDV